MKLLKPFALAMLAGVAVSAAGSSPAPVQVQASPSVSMAPATVRVLVTLEPDKRNRELVVEAESFDFYTSSAVTLDGDATSRINRFEFKNLPPGTYDIRVTVERTGGDRQTAATQTLVSG